MTPPARHGPRRSGSVGAMRAGDAADGACAFGAEDWSRFLSERLDLPVRVRFGRARRQVLVARPGGPAKILENGR